MNADGHLDLVIDNRDQLGLVVLHGDGQGEFASPGSAIAVEGQPYLGFALGDINGDGLIDVVTPNTNHVAVVISDTGSNFAVKQSIPMSAVFAVDVGDFNGDKHLDLIAASSSGAVHVYLGKGAGLFNLDSIRSVQVGSGAKQLITGDFNGDGTDDAAVATWGGTLHLLSLTPQYELKSQTVDTGLIKAPWGIAAGDLNGDRVAELVLTDGKGSQLNIYSISK